MSPRGTPNVAVVSGTIRQKTGGTSGHGVWLHGDNGNLYYYFHLESYEGGPRQVSQGEVVGYVGNTGDARGGATHTHFEIHPGGGGPRQPVPHGAGDLLARRAGRWALSVRPPRRRGTSDAEREQRGGHEHDGAAGGERPLTRRGEADDHADDADHRTPEQRRAERPRHLPARRHRQHHQRGDQQHARRPASQPRP